MPQLFVSFLGETWCPIIEGNECLDEFEVIGECNNYENLLEISLNNAECYHRNNKPIKWDCYTSNNLKIILNNIRKGGSFINDVRGEKCVELCKMLLQCADNNITFEEIMRCHKMFKLDNIEIDQCKIMSTSKECGYDNSTYDSYKITEQAKLILQTNKIIKFLKEILAQRLTRSFVKTTSWKIDSTYFT